jgi:hypothetical protein
MNHAYSSSGVETDCRLGGERLLSYSAGTRMDRHQLRVLKDCDDWGHLQLSVRVVRSAAATRVVTCPGLPKPVTVASA